MIRPTAEELVELGRLVERHRSVKRRMRKSTFLDWAELAASAALLLLGLAFDPPNDTVGRNLFLGGAVLFAWSAIKRIFHIIDILRLRIRYHLIGKEIARLGRKYGLDEPER